MERLIWTFLLKYSPSADSIYWSSVPLGRSLSIDAGISCILAQNDGYSANSQEIPVPMDNVRTEGTEYQSITSAYGEDLRRNVHMRRSGI